MFRRSKKPVPGTAGSQMSEVAKRTFARGVDQNMKIVIRGERGTGKTALFSRLQGKALAPGYTETPEIQVTNISWKYKQSAGVVKVEIWDVIDRGIPKTNSKAPLDGDVPMCLDASFVDVYKGTHGAIFLFDISKKWTLDYVVNAVMEVPPAVPILVLANFQDKADGTTCTVEEVEAKLADIPRPANAELIHVAKACLSDDFGLHFVNRFLGLPFLYVTRQWHEAQLAANRNENLVVKKELNEHGWNSEDQDYTKFIEKRKQRLAAAAEAASNKVVQSPPHDDTSSHAASRSASMSGGMFSRFRASLSAPKSKDTSPEKPGLPSSSQAADVPAAIDEFKPEEDLPDDFFGDSSEGTTKQEQAEQADNADDSDDNAGNPLVMAGDDDDDSDGEVNPLVAGDADNLDDSDDMGGNALVAGDASDVEFSDDNFDDSNDEIDQSEGAPPPAAPVEPEKPKAAVKKPRSKALFVPEDPGESTVDAIPAQNNPLVATFDDNSDNSDDDQGHGSDSKSAADSTKPSMYDIDPLAPAPEVEAAEDKPKKKKKKKKKDKRDVNVDDVEVLGSTDALDAFFNDDDGKSSAPEKAKKKKKKKSKDGEKKKKKKSKDRDGSSPDSPTMAAGDYDPI